MIENRHLRYFLEVAKSLHITRAAEQLHIAQPALTQNIQQLEEELGVKLFARQGRRLSLTEAGLVFVEEADRSLRTFYAAQLAVRRADRGERGTIVVGFQSTAGLTVVPEMLKRISEAYPDITVQLREMGSSAQRSALCQGEIDVAIMYSLPDREFSHHDLLPESLVIALQDAHPLAQRDSIALKEIAEDVLILPALDVAELLHQAVLAECAEVGFKPTRIQAIATAQTALALVSVGFGVSVLPASVRHIQRTGVTLRPIRNSRLQAQLTMMWLPRHPSPIIPKLRECLSTT